MKNYPSIEAMKQANREKRIGMAVEAYKFFYPMVYKFYLKKAVKDHAKTDLNNSVFTWTGNPNLVIMTANSDTPYYLMQLNTKEVGPLVFEIPAGKIVVFMSDWNQDYITDGGINGEDAGQGGKYLILPPGYTGEVPDGYIVRQANTYNIGMLIRVLGGADKKEVLSQFKTYPLGQEPKPLQLTEFEEDTVLETVPVDVEGTFEYWNAIKEAFDDDTYSQAHRDMYGFLDSVGIRAGEPFNPSPETKEILTIAAEKANMQLIANAFAGDEAERMVWDNRNWEWVVYGPDGGFDRKDFTNHIVRLRWFHQAAGNTPKMFVRRAGAGSIYLLGIKDNEGNYVRGENNYKLVVPAPVPGKLFFSLTIYDLNTRSTIITDQMEGAISSLRHADKVKPNEKGEIVMYVGPDEPADKNAGWVKTNKGEDWFAFFRVFGPEEDVFNGNWRLGDFEKLN